MCRRFWVVLDAGKLSEYTNWKDKIDLHMDPIDLRLASVREARDADRRFAFDVITPRFTRQYQATSEEEMRTWINAINNALQNAFENRLSPVSTNTSPVDSSKRDIGAVLTGKSPSVSGSHHSRRLSSNLPTAPPSSPTPVRIVTPSRHATVADRPSMQRSSSNDDNPTKLLQRLRVADPDNRNCADCGSDQKVEWVSINLGIVLCIECGGIHRSLGTHISKVRSLTLDTTTFTEDVIEILLNIGNRRANNVWEARLSSLSASANVVSTAAVSPTGPPSLHPNALDAPEPLAKPTFASSRDQRLKFITQKYVQRAFVQPISSTLSHYATPEETLIASIKRNDFPNVLYALALRASPNATDRSRSTPAVILALAAADPASPGSTISSTSLPRMPNFGRTGPASGDQAMRRTLFPVAELLIQNGADIPIISSSPIPLSRSAQMYIEIKTDQRLGRHFTSQGGGPAQGVRATDRSPGGRGGLLGRHQSGSGGTPGRDLAGGMIGDRLSPLPERPARDPGKLQKRRSGSGWNGGIGGAAHPT